MNANNGAPPPPYSRIDPSIEAQTVQEEANDTVPPYSSSPDSELQTAGDRKVQTTPETTGPRLNESDQETGTEAGPSSGAGPSTSTSVADAKADSSASFLQKVRESYQERKHAKEAARKVDFYEKMYGFVPKNIMTEAEWRAARERAPKVKVRPSLKAKPMFLGGAG